MAIDFTHGRWKELTETYRRWWANELDRPILGAALTGRDPGRPEPDIPLYHFAARYDKSVPPEAIVDRWDYNLSCNKYLGDAAPMMTVNFGPGVVAAFLGADAQPDENTVWFHSAKDLQIADVHLEYDGDNYWLNRVKDICRAAVQRWRGLVQVCMTDLGGNLDVLSTFRPADKLLLDLYDHPEEVKRVLREAHELWHRYFGEINEILRPTNPGHTAWAGIFSPDPYYMLQCDFAYMISAEMFGEFVRPELAATCRRLTNTFYHQDGVGQLAHTDLLLSIEELDGVQWVPGASRPQGTYWIDHYRRIVEAGKKVQLFDLATVDALAEQTGRSENIYYHWGGNLENEDQTRRTLKRYGVI